MKRKITKKIKKTKKHRKITGGAKGYEVTPHIETKIERLEDEVKPIEKRKFWGRSETKNIKFNKVKFGETIYYINMDSKGKKYEIREGSITNKTIKSNSPIHRILESFITYYSNPTKEAKIYHQYLTKSRLHQFTDPTRQNTIQITQRRNPSKKLKSKFAGISGSTNIDTSTATATPVTTTSTDPKIVSEAQKRLDEIRRREEAVRLRENNAQKAEEELEAKKKTAAAAAAAASAGQSTAAQVPAGQSTAAQVPAGPSTAVKAAVATDRVSLAGSTALNFFVGGSNNQLDILPPHNKVIVKRRFNDVNDKREFIVLTLLPSNTSYMSREAPHFWYRLINDGNKKTQHKLGDITASQILTGYAYLSNKYKKYSGNAVISIYRILNKDKAFKEGIPITDNDDAMEYSIDKKLFTKKTFATDQYPVSQPNFTKKTHLKFILEYPDIEDTTKQYTLIGWSKFKKYMYEDDPMQIRVLGL